MKLIYKLLLPASAVIVAGLVWAQQKTADQMSMEEKIAGGVPFHQQHSQPVDPFTVIGNIHSVGAQYVGVYLITTEEGHILVDTGVREMHEQIKANVRSLGFKVEDIKILLSTHAHFDHVQGHEAMRKATGAQVMAVGLDAEALRLGKDISPLGFEGWDPVNNVRTLKHGDLVSLGGVTMTANQIPGHTQGCTVWTIPVVDQGQSKEVAIFGCRGPNGIVKVIDNKDFPDLVEQTLLGFKRLKNLQPDIYLSNHPDKSFFEYGDAIRSGEKPKPSLNQQSWRAMVAELEQGFQARLK